VLVRSFAKVCALLCAISCTWVFAAANNSETKANESNAASQLAKLLGQECWFNGNFSQEKTVPNLPTILRSSGKFVFSCQQGVIWLNQQPMQEGFLFTTGNEQFRLAEDGALQPLAAKYQAYIGRFMLTLMDSEEAQLAAQFDIDLANQNPLTFELTPKQRRLKKAIQSIFVVQLPVTAADQPEVEVTLVDASGQTVRMVNTREQAFASAAELGGHCADFLGSVAAQSCAVLTKTGAEAEAGTESQNQTHISAAQPPNP